MSVEIYKCQWGFTNIGGDLQISLEIYRCLEIYKYQWGFTNISGDLQMSVVLIFTNIGGYL